MGLDMYLNKIKAEDIGRTEPTECWGWVEAEDGSLRVDTSTTVMREFEVEGEQVAYWRKANAIHAWFVDHCGGGVDECQRIYVEAEQLYGLLALCMEARERFGEGDFPWLEAHLPTRSGFFFGGTAYDEYYLEDINETIKLLEQVIAPGAFDPMTDRFYYQASW